MSHSCDEHYSVYDERFPTARKSHECEACHLPIRPGDRYASVAIVFDGKAERIKRCLRCQTIHEHLRELAPGEMWPDELLNCGRTYQDEWEREPPAWVAELAFWQPGDPLPALNWCTPSLRYDYERAICYPVPYWGQSGGKCRPRTPAWGIEDARSHDNDAHRRACTEVA